MLSSVYSTWMAQLLTGPLPDETKATCDDCAMLPRSGTAKDAVFFHPVTKCCTFQPNLTNYRAGLILSDDDSELAVGRRTVEHRLRTRIGVTPWGMEANESFKLLYKNARAAFGRASALGCQHQIAGRCGIWHHRPATCATWFCKYARGATGSEFWQSLNKLLNHVDLQLGFWCALEMGIDSGVLARLLEPKKLDAAELGAVFPEDSYRRLWGRWMGREAEYYRGCAERILPLAWADVVQICGADVAILSRLVRERHEKLLSESLPERPRLGLVQIQGAESGKYRAVTYSEYDPVLLSSALVAVLPHFDGRPAEEVLEEIRLQRGIRLNPALVRRMADFRVLVEDDAASPSACPAAQDPGLPTAGK